MEASSKDLARARFKQQRRDAFRDGRGRGGRGRGRGLSGHSPFDNDDEETDERAPEGTHGKARGSTRPEIDLPPEEDDETLDASGAVRPKSKGADLHTLFAECDQAALPRQHARTYLDPSWAVDDLATLERVARAQGDVGELSLDPVALEQRLRVLPLADLLGLSEDYRAYVAYGEGDGETTAATETADPETEVVSASVPAREKATDGETKPDVDLDVGNLLDERERSSARRVPSTSRGASRVSEEEDDDAELDALLDGTDGRGAAAPPRRRIEPERGFGPGPPKPSPLKSTVSKPAAHDEDALLDELLG